MNGNYTLQLKKRQLALLQDYKELVKKALIGFESPSSAFFRSFLEKERACLLKMKHLNKVISAFPVQQDGYIDKNLDRSYGEVQKELNILMDRIRDKKSSLRFRDKQFLMKNHRQKRLYREIKPAYIDICT